MREWWWRFRYAVRIWRVVPWMAWRDAWGVAWAGDYDHEYSPSDAADEELTYWSE